MATLENLAGTLLLDNFDGTGAIDGRVPEVSEFGNWWSNYLEGKVVGGYATAETSSSNLLGRIGWTSPELRPTISRGWQFDAAFEVPAFDYSTTVSYHILWFQASSTDFNVSVDLMWRRPASYPAGTNGFVLEIKLTEAGVSAFDSLPSPSYIQLGDLPIGAHTLRFSLSAEGVFELYYDEGLAASESTAVTPAITFAAKQPLTGGSLYMASYPGGGAVSVDAIRLMELGAPPTFWTSFVGSYEMP